MSYMTISSQENHHFSICSYFHSHPTTLLLKILGGPMQGPSPHLKLLGGPSPQSSPTSPPLPWILVSIVFWNYDNYCLQYQAGPTNLSRILKLLKLWILVTMTKFIF